MNILEAWAAAEFSSDLKHHEKDCDVDILGAVGLASHKNGYVAIYRLKYLGDIYSVPDAAKQFLEWTKISLVRRRFKIKAEGLSKKILQHWVNDVCKSCHGRMYDTMAESLLSHRPCKDCEGLGKRPFRSEKREVDVATDVIERADKSVNGLRMRVVKRLG